MKKKILIVIFLIIIIFLFGIGINTIYLSHIEDKDQIINNDTERELGSANNNEENISIKGIFNEYEKQANEKLKSMTIDEKIGQIFLVRFPNNDGAEVLKQYKFGGYIFFAKDFIGKTRRASKR